MAFLGGGTFCLAQEYWRHEPNRLREEDLQPDELYTVMLLLKSRKREAARLAARLTERTQKSGMAVLRLAFLDHDLQARLETVGTMTDGIMTDLCKGLIVREAGAKGRYDISQAYIRDYFDDMYEHMLQAAQGQAVGSAQ